MNRMNLCIVALLVLGSVPASAQTVPEIELVATAVFPKLTIAP